MAEHAAELGSKNGIVTVLDCLLSYANQLGVKELMSKDDPCAISRCLTLLESATETPVKILIIGICKTVAQDNLSNRVMLFNEGAIGLVIDVLQDVARSTPHQSTIALVENCLSFLVDWETTPHALQNIAEEGGLQAVHAVLHMEPLPVSSVILCAKLCLNLVEEPGRAQMVLQANLLSPFLVAIQHSTEFGDSWTLLTVICAFLSTVAKRAQCGTEFSLCGVIPTLFDLMEKFSTTWEVQWPCFQVIQAIWDQNLELRQMLVDEGGLNLLLSCVAQQAKDERLLLAILPIFVSMLSLAATDATQTPLSNQEVQVVLALPSYHPENSFMQAHIINAIAILLQDPTACAYFLQNQGIEILAQIILSPACRNDFSKLGGVVDVLYLLTEKAKPHGDALVRCVACAFAIAFQLQCDDQTLKKLCSCVPLLVAKDFSPLSAIVLELLVSFPTSGHLWGSLVYILPHVEADFPPFAVMIVTVLERFLSLKDLPRQCKVLMDVALQLLPKSPKFTEALVLSTFPQNCILLLGILLHTRATEEITIVVRVLANLTSSSSGAAATLPKEGLQHFLNILGDATVMESVRSEAMVCLGNMVEQNRTTAPPTIISQLAETESTLSRAFLCALLYLHYPSWRPLIKTAGLHLEISTASRAVFLSPWQRTRCEEAAQIVQADLLQSVQTQPLPNVPASPAKANLNSGNEPSETPRMDTMSTEDSNSKFDSQTEPVWPLVAPRNNRDFSRPGKTAEVGVQTDVGAQFLPVESRRAASSQTEKRTASENSTSTADSSVGLECQIDKPSQTWDVQLRALRRKVREQEDELVAHRNTGTTMRKEIVVLNQASREMALTAENTKQQLEGQLLQTSKSLEVAQEENARLRQAHQLQFNSSSSQTETATPSNANDDVIRKMSTIVQQAHRREAEREAIRKAERETELLKLAQQQSEIGKLENLWQTTERRMQIKDLEMEELTLRTLLQSGEGEGRADIRLSHYIDLEALAQRWLEQLRVTAKQQQVVAEGQVEEKTKLETAFEAYAGFARRTVWEEEQIRRGTLYLEQNEEWQMAVATLQRDLAANLLTKSTAADRVLERFNLVTSVVVTEMLSRHEMLQLESSRLFRAQVEQQSTLETSALELQAHQGFLDIASGSLLELSLALNERERGITEVEQIHGRISERETRAAELEETISQIEAKLCISRMAYERKEVELAEKEARLQNEDERIQTMMREGEAMEASAKRLHIESAACKAQAAGFLEEAAAKFALAEAADARLLIEKERLEERSKQLALRQLEAYAQQAEARKLEDEVNQREALLEVRESAVERKEEHFKNLEIHIHGKITTMKTAESRLLEREKEVTTRENEVTVREASLATRQAHQQDTEAKMRLNLRDILQREAAVKERESSLTELEQRLTRQKEDLEALGLDLTIREADLVCREEEATRRTANLGQQEKVFEKREKKLSHLEREANKRVKALLHREAETVKGEKELTDWMEEMEWRERQLDWTEVKGLPTLSVQQACLFSSVNPHHPTPTRNVESKQEKLKQSYAARRERTVQAMQTVPHFSRDSWLLDVQSTADVEQLESSVNQIAKQFYRAHAWSAKPSPQEEAPTDSLRESFRVVAHQDRKLQQESHLLQCVRSCPLAQPERFSSESSLLLNIRKWWKETADKVLGRYRQLLDERATVMLNALDLLNTPEGRAIQMHLVQQRVGKTASNSEVKQKISWTLAGLPGSALPRAKPNPYAVIPRSVRRQGTKRPVNTNEAPVPPQHAGNFASGAPDTVKTPSVVQDAPPSASTRRSSTADSSASHSRRSNQSQSNAASGSSATDSNSGSSSSESTQSASDSDESSG
eukprot:TRINITY_DN11783_c0_g1_i3.p1 TRINITY_DN11783_c0_g1~~TRINITY_DN11783_c0_g1_i3.p1  ORF type:complete len:1837 (-),score=342.64 TRINITY_DN11783_c0_g1_i3:117-5627(-)